MVCYRVMDDRPVMPVAEFGLRAQAYGLTVLEAAQRQMDHRLAKN